MATEEVVLDVNINAPNAGKTLGELRKSIESINAELEDTAIGSEAFDKLSKELTAANKEVKNLELSFEALDVEQQASELGSVAGAVGDVTSAFVLLGGESDTLQQIAGNIQKAIGISIAFKGAIEGVASARKLLNSLDKESAIIKAKDAVLTRTAAAAQALYALVVGTSTGALKLFKIALASTGIGLLIIGIGALVANWEEFTKWIKNSSDAFVEFAKNLAPIRFFLEWWIGKTYEQIEAEDQAAKQRRAEQKKISQEHNERIKQINDELNATVRASNDKISALETERQIKEAAGEESLDITKQILKEELAKTQAVLDANKKKIESWVEYYKLQAELSGQSEEQFIESMKQRGIDLESLNNQAEELLKQNEDAVRLAEARITGLEKKERQKRSQEANRIRQAQEKKDQEALNAKLKRIQEESKLLMDFYNEVEKLENEYFDSQLTAQQREENAVRDKYFSLIEQAKKYGEDSSILEAAREQELLDIRNEYREKEIEADAEAKQLLKEQEEQDIEDRNAALQAQAQTVIDSAQNVINSLASIQSIANDKEIARIKKKQEAGEKLSKKEMQRLKRDEAAKKAFAVSEIAINTARGIAEAVAAGAGLPFPTNIPAILSGVAAVLSGVAQANKVINAPSPSVGNIDANTSLDGGNELTQDAPNTDLFNTGSSLLNQPNQKVYVLESDITNTQDNVAAIKEQATFG